MNDIQKVIDALNLEALPQEEQSAALLTFGDLIFKSSFTKILQTLDEGKQAELVALVEKNGSEQELMDFMAREVPDADQMVGEAVAELSGDIIALSN